MYNLQYPREICNPKRSVVTNSKQFINFINSNGSTSNLYTNVYNYEKFTDGYFHPVYESAIIDRIYTDLDQTIKKDGKVVKVDAYKNMIKIHEWCLAEDIIHYPRCTGTGYDVIIATDPNTFIRNKKTCVGNAQMWLEKELDVQIDRQVIGDISRIHRVDNTFNFKQQTRRFCIPLDDDIIYEGEEKIFEIASKQRFTNNRYGTKYWDISEFDTAEPIYRDYLDTNNNMEINEENMSELCKHIPICIKRLLSFDHCGWKERRCIILCLRDNYYLQDEVITLLKEHLNKKDFRHCVQEERQVHFLYRNGKYFFSHKQELIELGVCEFKEAGTYCKNAKHGCLLYDR